MPLVARMAATAVEAAVEVKEGVGGSLILLHRHLSL
jgi:hypothetical protein